MIAVITRIITAMRQDKQFFEVYAASIDWPLIDGDFMGIKLLLIQFFHLVSAVNDIRTAFAHEVLALGKLLWLFDFIHYFDGRNIRIVNRVNSKFNMVLNQEIHKSRLFLRW